MDKVIIDNKEYDVVRNYRDALNVSDLEGKITDYFDSFDYILGDYAYGKVRLKGFNEKGNKNYKTINDYAKVDEYIKTNCAYDCRYFILKTLPVEKK